MPDAGRGARGAIALLAGALVAVVVAVGALAADRRDLAFANGVAPREAVATLAPGARACQEAVAVVEPFAALRVAADSAGAGGPALEVAVSAGRRRVSGRVAGGYVARRDDAESYPTAVVGPVPAGGSVDVCVSNRGPSALMLAGTLGAEAPTSRLSLGPGDSPPADLHLVFLRRQPVSLLSQLPAAFERAALFHPPLVGAWTFWLLAAAVALGVPLALAAALRATDGRGE